MMHKIHFLFYELFSVLISFDGMAHKALHVLHDGLWVIGHKQLHIYVLVLEWV